MPVKAGPRGDLDSTLPGFAIWQAGDLRAACFLIVRSGWLGPWGPQALGPVHGQGRLRMRPPEFAYNHGRDGQGRPGRRDTHRAP